MTSTEIRQSFLDFFKSKGHQYVKSSPIVVKDDPTLMFTNAGMNQFKDFFLGTKTPTNTRVANSQKCLRVSGKHNDLEEVGHDTYHHTMFEMLGNWSFGDYFKKETIDWAWELITEVYGLPKNRLYATVFEGSLEDNIEDDKEAYSYWQNHLSENRILYGSKKDNFWEMGETGPCGPASELHIDLRPESEIEKVPGRDLVNQDHPLVVEIWNLVFIQFERKANGKLLELPAKHIDTGMGFERIAMAIQEKESNYDTDVFSPLINKIEELTGHKYGTDTKVDTAIRVVADHIRAITFTIADGQLPSNNKAGYVIRRILRRAVRYGYTFLGQNDPFLFKLVEVLSHQFQEFFPEVEQQKDLIKRVVEQEEKNFLSTLEKGLKRLDVLMKENSKSEISGDHAFELYDTFGFPLDLTMVIAKENNFQVDIKRFEECLLEQKKRSKEDAIREQGDWTTYETEKEAEFIGYDQTNASVKITRAREVSQKKKKVFELVLDKTPFYAESGGQIGDTGILKGANETIRVLDTYKENDLIIHKVDRLPENPTSLFSAIVDFDRRTKITANHTATHLMYSALKRVLGDHVQQKGSLVNENLLRFDFSHFEKLKEEEIKEVELIVNQKIRENIEKDEQRNVAIEHAKEQGATALFGEKYGDYVRVISFDPSYSIELCGGTHVSHTGNLGYFRIVSETSVAAGIRRIEALTGKAAYEYDQKQREELIAVKQLLNNPTDASKSVENLLKERSELEKELERLRTKNLMSLKESLSKKIVKDDSLGFSFIIEKCDLGTTDELKQLSFELSKSHEKTLVALASEINSKPMLSIILDKDHIDLFPAKANDLIKAAAPFIKGGGGGQPFYATAGGKDPSGLNKALIEIKSQLGLVK